jgi:uncharacterized protein
MDILQLHVTALYAGILALLYVALAAYVIQGRAQYRVNLGDGDHPAMVRRIRIHGNFSEYIPFCLLLMLILEQGRVSAWLLHVAGIVLIVGRIAYFIGLTRTDGPSIGRAFGAACVFAVLIVGGLRTIALALGL